MNDKRFPTPKSYAEFYGTLGVQEKGASIEINGEEADYLCAGIAAIMDENVELHKDAEHDDTIIQSWILLEEELKSDIAKLRARVGEMEARYDNVTISLKEKCAELAALKPDWSDAPEWADRMVAWVYWVETKYEGRVDKACRVVIERRPEES